MKVAEIFYSIQGEGKLAGVPSVFVRTSGCNLRCKWCDTPYTSWRPEGDEISVDQILKTVTRFGAAHVVVTGGEPMIAPEIVSLTRILHAGGQHVTIETAGTVLAPVTADLMSISPKLANSTPFDREDGRWATHHDRLRYQPDVLRRLMADYEYQMKFVVADPDDLAEIDEILHETGASRSHVVLMPEGTRAEVVRERGLWLAEICKRTGFRY